MKIGIIVHSFSGHTLSVAEKLEEALKRSGHSVNIERVSAVNEKQSDSKDIRLATVPDISAYDAVIFGCPVRGFSVSPVLKEYLLQLAALNGKRVGIIVTQSFPYPFMGGNKTVNQIKSICAEKQGSVFASGIVNWSGGSRDKRINEVIKKFEQETARL